MHSHTRTGTAGFTLIELLVVIAIIGILASVVLASLNTARNKGADAAIKSDVDSARAQAELYYDANGATNGYTNVCTGSVGSVKGIAAMKAAASSAGSASVVCNSSASAWVLSAQLKSTTQYWCTDNTGTSTATSTQVAGTNTTC